MIDFTDLPLKTHTILHKNISLLKKQLTEANQTIKKLRRELAIAKKEYMNEDERSWAELDDRKNN